MQTPGYCSIFIDDVTVTHLSTPGISDEPVYTEYIPIKKDASGKINPVSETAEAEIIDSRLDIYERYQQLLEEAEFADDFDDFSLEEIDDFDDYSGTVNRVKKKSTTVSIKRNPLTFLDILTCNSYVWYTVVFYAAAGVVLAAAALIIILILRKKRKKGVAVNE